MKSFETDTDLLPRIRQLPPEIANKIAAGEVIERPASVVKELIENAIDAGASQINVELEDAGKQAIRVIDNGCGISPDDLHLAFAAHATSKLESADDLFTIGTMGFRGEALASIGSIAQTRILSRTADTLEAFELRCDGGRLGEVTPASGPVGTCIEVRNLFYHTPVRRRFLRQNSTELSHVMDMIQRTALGWPKVGFSLTSDGRSVFRLAAAESLRERVSDVAGRAVAERLIEVNESNSYASLTGYVGPIDLHKPNSKELNLFVNNRYIRDRSLLHAITLAYREYIPHGRFPVAWIFLTLDPTEVDVNVHPTKIEVRFHEANRLFGLIKGAVQETVLRSGQLPKISLNDRRLEEVRRIGQQSSQAEIYRAMHDFMGRQPIVQARPESGRDPELALERSGYDTPEDAEEQRRGSLLPPQALASAREYTAKGVPTNHAQDVVEPELATFEVAAPAGAGAPPATGEAIEPAKQQSLLRGARGLFQVGNTYLIVETDEGLVLIDQHAYHERILFWQLEHRLATHAPEMQHLAIPEPLELTPQATAMVGDALELLRSFGFVLEPFGNKAWACTALPRYVRVSKVGEFVQSCLEEMALSGRGKDPASLRKSMVEMTACRAAIKAGDSLTSAEIEMLLEEGAKVPHTFACPHGRPTTFRLTFEDLEKIFHRR